MTVDVTPTGYKPAADAGPAVPSMVRFGAMRMPLEALARLGSDRLTRIYRHWQRSADDSGLPRWSGITSDTQDLFLGVVSVLDVLDEAEDFSFRLVGPFFAKTFDRDPTGWRVSALEPKEFSVMVSGHYREVAQSGEPALHRLDLRRDGWCRCYHRLTLPASRTGARIDTLLIAYAIAGADAASGCVPADLAFS